MDQLNKASELADASQRADSALLEKRVGALQKVVVTERRLRQLLQQKLDASQHLADSHAQLQPPPLDDDSTVLHRRPQPLDDDSTVLQMRAPLDDDSTVLARQNGNSARPVQGAVPLVLAPGCQLFEYRIDTVLGQGGFGVTYLATDIHLRAKVAIKEYLPAEYAQRSNDRSVSPRWAEDRAVYQEGLDSFLVEARTLATFRHPNIVRVARFFEANRTAYMVLEYERGEPLKTWWPRKQDLSEAEMLSLLQPLVDGLAVVHGAGFLHRDIKPDNIYVRKDDGRLVLLDFGAARLAVGPATTMADVVTPGYAPPEQYQNGDQGPWTDIYSLAATLYWMVTGAKPPAAPARQDGSEPMTPAVEAGHGRYSDCFLRAIDWALMLDPADRPQDLQAFSKMLFANHAASLSLRDALKAGELEPVGTESLRMLLDSPRLLQRRALQLGRALIHPGSWPMVVKMTLAMMVAALLPMIITANYNLDGSVSAVSASELRNLERLAQSTAGRVSQLLTDSQDLANYMATDPDFIDYIAHPDQARTPLVEAKLGNLIRTNPGVHLMFLMNADGLALVSSEPGVAGVNFKFREYFQEAVQGRPFKTGIIVGSTAGKRGMYYANPVRDAKQQIIGVVVLRIKASTIGAILDEMTAGTGRVPFMIDGDGVLIHYPDERQLHHSLAALPPAAQQRIAADQRFRLNKVDSLNMPALATALVGTRRAGHISYMSTLSGSEEYAGYAPVPGHNWVVGVTESRRSFEAPLQDLYTKVLHSVGLVGLVFLVLAVLFARSIVRPIARLTVAANALTEGDYDKANITVTSGDEIGRLARTFNVMIDVLRQREREKRGDIGQRRTRGDDD